MGGKVEVMERNKVMVEVYSGKVVERRNSGEIEVVDGDGRNVF